MQNSVGNSLTEQTGTGKFVGDTAPTITNSLLVNPTIMTKSLDLTVLSTDVFTTNGTWTKPANTTYVDVLLIGGGGGGGSGCSGPNGNHRLGGAGGKGGSIIYIRAIPEKFLGATEAVVIGAGATGGVGVTGTSNGNNGNIGGSTTFSYYQADGGFYGRGGLYGSSQMAKVDYPVFLASGFINFNEPALTLLYRDNENLANLTSSQAMFEQSSNLDTSVSNKVSQFNGFVLEVNQAKPTGGSAGGSINSSNATVPNSSFTILDEPYTSKSYPVIIDIPSFPYSRVFIDGSATTGNNGTTYATYYGVGGSGGYSNLGGNGYDGGDGGVYGGAGGGGGSCLDSSTSGAGGDGADGVAVIISYSGS